MVPIPFKLKYRIHHMFQHLRSGNRSVLGNMPHYKDWGIGFFSITKEFCRAFTHLRYGSWSGFDLRRVQGLYGIYEIGSAYWRECESVCVMTTVTRNTGIL